MCGCICGYGSWLEGIWGSTLVAIFAIRPRRVLLHASDSSSGFIRWARRWLDDAFVQSGTGSLWTLVCSQHENCGVTPTQLPFSPCKRMTAAISLSATISAASSSSSIKNAANSIKSKLPHQQMQTQCNFPCSLSAMVHPAAQPDIPVFWRIYEPGCCCGISFGRIRGEIFELSALVFVLKQVCWFPHFSCRYSFHRCPKGNGGEVCVFFFPLQLLYHYQAMPGFDL